jgi:hypothetical protein
LLLQGEEVVWCSLDAHVLVSGSRAGLGGGSGPCIVRALLSLLLLHLLLLLLGDLNQLLEHLLLLFLGLQLLLLLLELQLELRGEQVHGGHVREGLLPCPVHAHGAALGEHLQRVGREHEALHALLLPRNLLP